MKAKSEVYSNYHKTVKAVLCVLLNLALLTIAYCSRNYRGLLFKLKISHTAVWEKREKRKDILKKSKDLKERGEKKLLPGHPIIISLQKITKHPLKVTSLNYGFIISFAKMCCVSIP